MNAKLRAILLPILRTVRSGKAPSFRNRSAAEQAIFLLGKRSTRGKKAAAARKAKKVTEHRDSTTSIREAVFQRAQGVCELLCSPALPATELHHLEGGSARRALQKLENCVAACEWCHRLYHREPETFRHRIEQWAAHYSYPIPRRFRGEPLTRKANP